MREIEFGNIKTNTDLGLRISKLKISNPDPKTMFIDIPFSDGALDLTESLTGEVEYKNRSFEAEFRMYMDEDYQSKLSDINNLLHGQRIEIRTPERVGHYLKGRCFVDHVLANHYWIDLVVVAECEPYYYKDDLTIHTVSINSTGTANVNLTNSRKRVIPTIINSAEVTINFNGKTTVVSAGSHQFTNIILTEGDNPITISGAQGTTVRFEYQEGAL